MRREAGQITVMTIGFFVFLGLLAVVVINSSAAFLQRQQLDNVADGAALAAADGLSRADFYRRGEVRLDGSEARRLIGEYVTGDGIRVVAVRTDGDQVHVRLERTVSLAFAPPGWTSRTTIVSEATSQLRLGD
ncbi:pilus assembly protein TadG-related protein [Aeromicrobium sp.]|uniref:pilus assembly protein TadG-related protein n=1 Tax=Aeromicrobium sp. TaxID=1871063 RepID=UPI002FC8F36B